MDGANYIEETFKKTGIFPQKRTNMDVHIADKERGGVDLNRNFGFQYGVGRSNKDEI